MAGVRVRDTFPVQEGHIHHNWRVWYVGHCTCSCVRCAQLETDLNPQQPRRQATPTHRTVNTSALRNSLDRVKYTHPLVDVHTIRDEGVYSAVRQHIFTSLQQLKKS